MDTKTTTTASNHPAVFFPLDPSMLVSFDDYECASLSESVAAAAGATTTTTTDPDDDDGGNWLFHGQEEQPRVSASEFLPITMVDGSRGLNSVDNHDDDDDYDTGMKTIFKMGPPATTEYGGDDDTDDLDEYLATILDEAAPSSSSSLLRVANTVSFDEDDSDAAHYMYQPYQPHSNGHDEAPLLVLEDATKYEEDQPITMELLTKQQEQELYESLLVNDDDDDDDDKVENPKHQESYEPLTHDNADEDQLAEFFTGRPSTWLNQQLASYSFHHDSFSSSSFAALGRQQETTPGPVPRRRQQQQQQQQRRNKSKHCIQSQKKRKDGSKSPNFYANILTRHVHFTPEEDEKLKWGMQEYYCPSKKKTVEGTGGGRVDWAQISAVAFGHTRSMIQCKNRWYNHLQPGKKKGNWQRDEDEYIRYMVHTQQCFGKWREIAVSGLQHRTPNQIRARYVEHLDPHRKPKHTPWTDAELQILHEQQQQLGNQWKKISKFLPGRTKMDIKNKYWNQRKQLRCYQIES